MKKSTVIIFAVMLFILSACGYRLAGKADLDSIFEKTHVSYQGRGHAVAELIENQFKANQYQIVERDDADAIVDVLYERTDKEILSLDEDGKVREYKLVLRVGINVKDSQGTVYVNNQEFRLSRDFLFEINELLGKTQEERKIFQEMRADVSRLVLYRLQAISVEDIEEAKQKAAEATEENTVN